MDRTRKNIASLVSESVQKATSNKREYELFSRIGIFIKDPLPEDLSLEWVLNNIEEIIPEFFVHEIDGIYIGQFDELISREVNALFKDGVIYVTNDQSDEEDMLDDIVHEISHNVEVLYGMEIYSDSKIEVEFLGKRKRLFNILKAEYGDLSVNKVGRYFVSTEYSRDFDAWLYKVIGYPALTSISMGLFSSPYAITSLREYFAAGFTEYYLGDRKYLRTISPNLYKKIIDLTTIRR